MRYFVDRRLPNCLSGHSSAQQSTGSVGISCFHPIKCRLAAKVPQVLQAEGDAPTTPLPSSCSLHWSLHGRIHPPSHLDSVRRCRCLQVVDRSVSCAFCCFFGRRCERWTLSKIPHRVRSDGGLLSRGWYRSSSRSFMSNLLLFFLVSMNELQDAHRSCSFIDLLARIFDGENASFSVASSFASSSSSSNACLGAAISRFCRLFV